jgi:hypothetical protein
MSGMGINSSYTQKRKRNGEYQPASEVETAQNQEG